MNTNLTARYRQARNHPQFCVLEGLHAIKHAMRFAAEIVEVHSHKEASWRSLIEDLAPELKQSLQPIVQDIALHDFNALAPRPPHTGIIAIARKPAFDLRALWANGPKTPVIVLDRPAHPGNTGAVIRTAAAAGARAVLCRGQEDPWHPACLRGSAGLHFAVPTSRIDDHEWPDLPVIGLDAEGEPLNTQDLPQDAIYLFGSERDGICEDMRKRVTKLVAIPMRPGVSSLNLAASVAILLYQGLQPSG